MNKAAAIFAKTAGLYKVINTLMEANRGIQHPTVTASLAEEYYGRYENIRKALSEVLPDLFSDLPVRDLPIAPIGQGTHTYYYLTILKKLIEDMDYIFEVHANSELKVEHMQAPTTERPRRIFISHGRSQDWREVQAYLEKDLQMDTLELAQSPNRGRTILQKLDDESNQCSFAVVVMTGDDEVDSSAPRVRENVMHEIGYFQGKYGLANVCLLHEEGTNIPSNIHGVVYIPFPKGLVSAAFGVLAREIKAAFAA